MFFIIQYSGFSPRNPAKMAIILRKKKTFLRFDTWLYARSPSFPRNFPRLSPLPNQLGCFRLFGNNAAGQVFIPPYLLAALVGSDLLSPQSRAEME